MKAAAPAPSLPKAAGPTPKATPKAIPASSSRGF